MIKTESLIEFITYDGQPGSRPPIFDSAVAKNLPLVHDLDGKHMDLMVVPAGHHKPLSMAFMLFYLDVAQEFEWCSNYSAKELCNEGGVEVALDEAGYISFPLQKGDRWAFWPTISLN